MLECVFLMVRQGLLTVEVSISHLDAPQSVGHFWTSYQPVADTSGRVISPSQRPLPDDTQRSQETDPWPQRDSNPQSQQASGRRPTP